MKDALLHYPFLGTGDWQAATEKIHRHKVRSFFESRTCRSLRIRICLEKKSDDLNRRGGEKRIGFGLNIGDPIRFPAFAVRLL